MVTYYYVRQLVRYTRRIAMEDEAPAWKEGDFIGEKFGGFSGSD